MNYLGGQGRFAVALDQRHGVDGGRSPPESRDVIALRLHDAFWGIDFANFAPHRHLRSIGSAQDVVKRTAWAKINFAHRKRIPVWAEPFAQVFRFGAGFEYSLPRGVEDPCEQDLSI